MDKYLLAILIIAIALLFVFRTGAFYWNDDFNYITFAQQIAVGHFNPTLNPFSYGWLFPYFVYLSGAVYGTSAYGYAALTTIAEYISLIGLTYILAKRLYPQHSATIPRLAALMVAIFPFILQIATRVLNDLLLGVVASLAIVFLLSDRKWDWLLSGLMAGLLISIKLIGFAFVIPYGLVALYYMLYKQSRLKGLYVILGLGIALAIYTIPFALLAHNPLYSIEGYGTFQSSLSPSTPQTNLYTLFVELGLVTSPPLGNAFWQTYSYGILLWLALFGAFLAHKHRDRGLLLMAILAWGFILYIHFGTITLSHYSVQTVVSRYLCLVAAPLAILIVYALMSIRWWVKQNPPVVLFIVIGLLILIGAYSLWHTYTLIYQFNSLIRQGNYQAVATLIGWKLPANVPT